MDAMHKLQQIEDEMNQYRIKKGKKPTQRASVIIAGMVQVDLCCCISHSDVLTANMVLFPLALDELVRSDCSSLSSLPLDDGESDSKCSDEL